jgi:two-component system chemotaxis sensor kinase CheA
LIRVEADKLDQLINLVGELVIAGSGTQLLAQRAGLPTLVESSAHMSRLVEEVRDTALGLRMVQIGATFQRFQRVVRDVSLELSKDIELVISGGDTELDKSVVERIGDPLMHLVRNAMDHGIEPPEARTASGKPAKAQVRLNAFHDSGSIVIEISDDGRGLNREKIVRKARERGLVAEGAALSEQEIFRLIFEPGFSTADQVSNLSGRGVGMDVVKRSIEALRGTVELHSRPAIGTTVRIRLPLTLAIIDGFLVGVGPAQYVIPLDMVLECLELPAGERQAARERGYFSLRDNVLPLLWVSDLFQLPEAAKQGRENIVVVRFGGRTAGLVVDRLMGEFQTVIKPLGRLFGNLRGISGFTILGSGDVALILDVPSLIQKVAIGERSSVESQGSDASRKECLAV